MSLKETLVAKRRAEMVSARSARPAGGLPCCFNVRTRGIPVRHYHADIEFSGCIYFANRKAYAWRYVYPGMAGMGLFVLFPLVCTIAIAFTNYSSTNQLTFERAQEVLLDRSRKQPKPITLVFTRRAMSGNLRSATAKPAKITSPTLLNLAASKNCN